MTISAIVADDERLPRLKLLDLLAEVPWIACVGEASDGLATVEAVNRLRPDLLFLDIRMPGLSGLEVLRRLEHRPHIVFTTAYDEYAVAAFEVRALDYLLKPFGRKRFQDSLERVREAVGRTSHAVVGGLEALEPKQPLRRLFVRTRGGIVPIATDDVSHFEASGDYVEIHTTNGRYLANLRMGDLENQLDPDRFVRIHRSHIVSLEHVVSMTPDPSGRLLVCLRDGTGLFASRARSRALRRRVV